MPDGGCAPEGRVGRAGPWPGDAPTLVAEQEALATKVARAPAPWRPAAEVLAGGCFVAPLPPEDPARPWRCDARAAAVAWRAGAGLVSGLRRSDAALRGTTGTPRRARDLDAQVVVAGHLEAPYVPGLLALRHGPLLAAAVTALPVPLDVLLVDATGLDHPRRAGLAVQLGAVLGVPTVGVTDRPLLARGEVPGPARGACRPVILGGDVVGFLVRTRDGVRPVVAHAAWRTTPAVAAEVVLATSTGAARTPVPLQEARRVAREARFAAGPRRRR